MVFTQSMIALITFYKQYNLFEVRDQFNELLYEVRQDRNNNIDFSKSFNNIV